MIALPRIFAPRSHGPARSALWLAEGLLSLRRQRRSLANLGPHLLRDIGVSPEEAEKEAKRPIWDAPEHWR